MGAGLVTVSIQLPEGVEPPSTVAGMLTRQAEYESEAEGWSDLLFSEAYACSVCGYSMPDLEPRMFSFNSPYGACTDCMGLGTRTEFDPILVAPDHSKPLRSGAILPFVYKSGEVKDWWPEMLDAVGKEMGFDASLPISEIPEEGMNAVWHGLKKPIEVKMKYGRTERTFKQEWKGVLVSLRKRFEETTSEWVKQDLEQYQSTKPCPACGGRRLKPESLLVKVADHDMSQITKMSIVDAVTFFVGLPPKLTKRQLTIAERAVKEIAERLKFLLDVGLGYLTLDRNARTLSGGEAQRIRLATQIGSGLMGCLYVLDEPSIGLHQRDNKKLIETLERLKALGNTVLVVEHDEETMLAADYLLELGPGAGEHGGVVVASGTVKEFLKSNTMTAEYLSGKREIAIPKTRRLPRVPAEPVEPIILKSDKKMRKPTKSRASDLGLPTKTK